MSILGIIQARMGSSRLPGKILQDVCGKPLLARVVERARRATTLSSVIVATSVDPVDDATESFCRAAGVPVFRGDCSDVLDRFYRAAEQHSGDTIVRLTGDSPLLEPQIVDLVVRAYQTGGCDYATNTQPPTFPDGLDVEVFSRTVLEEVHAEAKRPSEREHVTPFIYQQPQRYRIRNVANGEDLSALRWTVDEPRDLEFVRRVYSHFERDDLTWVDILRWMREDPTLQKINSGIQRNEGYLKSLEKESSL